MHSLLPVGREEDDESGWEVISCRSRMKVLKRTMAFTTGSRYEDIP